MKKIDIDDEFRDIISKFGYIGIHDIKTDIYLKIEKLMYDIGKKYKNIAIRCGGNHTARLLEEFGHILGVKLIIDRNKDKVNRRVVSYNIPIVEKITEELMDVIIISTYDYREEIKKELEDFDVKIIDIYDYLEQAGFHLTEEFYNVGNDKEIYKRLIEGNQRYKNAINRLEKQRALDDLIGMYLDDRDIYSAINCINEYIICRYSGYLEKEELLYQINNLMRKIGHACQERKQQDIFWLWQDGMFFEVVENMPYLKQWGEQGIFFKNAYSVNTSTRHVYSRIFDLRDEYEMYHDADKKPQQHIMIEMLRQYGYSCQKIRGVKRSPICLDNLDIYNMPRLMITDAALTEIYWEALREMLLSDVPVFLLLHTGLETHLPAMAPNLEHYYDYGVESLAERFEEEGRKRFLDRVNQTAQYLDAEMQFLFGLLGDTSVKIVMSDHGDALTKNSYCFTNDCSHIVLIAGGGNLFARKCEKLVDIGNFYMLLKDILEKSEVDNLFSDEIKFVTVDVYGEEFIRELISIDFAYFGIAFCGVMTAHDRFVKFATGEEVYNIFPDDFTNHIHENMYQERISYLREQAGERFINITENKKFKNSYLLYEAVGRQRMV